MLLKLLAILLGLIFPTGYTFLVATSNQQFIRSEFTQVDINWLIFQWQTIFHIVWIVTAIMLSIFYIYNVFVKGHWIYALGIPLHIGAFIFMWFLILVVSGQLFIYETVNVQNTDYHLVQIASHGNGQLYVFTCKTSLCDVAQVGFVDSSRYFGAEMTYDGSTHTLNIKADDGYEIDEISYLLD